MGEDIVPDLLEMIEKEFGQQTLKSEKIKKALQLLQEGKATYLDANDFAIEVGEILASVFGKNITAEDTPDDIKEQAYSAFQLALARENRAQSDYANAAVDDHNARNDAFYATFHAQIDDAKKAMENATANNSAALRMLQDGTDPEAYGQSLLRGMQSPNAGGDEYNHTPTGKSKHSHTPKQKTSDIPWEYGDTTSQMFSELSKKFEGSFGTKNGLDMSTLS